MAGSSKTPSDPNLADVLNQLKKDVFLSLNCHGIGIVESFDSDNQTIKATMAYKKTFVKFENGQEKEDLVEYPILLDCPAIVLGGGTFSIKLPIAKGDECFIMFNDRSIDRWFESGQITSLESSRLHSFSDAVILVGLHSTNKSLSGYSADHAIIGDGTHDLKLGSDEASLNVNDTIVAAVGAKVNLANAVESLNAILQDLLTEIQAISVTGVTTGPGASGPPANIANFALIATRLGGLLL